MGSFNKSPPSLQLVRKTSNVLQIRQDNQMALVAMVTTSRCTSLHETCGTCLMGAHQDARIWPKSQGAALLSGPWDAQMVCRHFGKTRGTSAVGRQGRGRERGEENCLVQKPHFRMNSS
uniref:Uncharacterized protein n=1 Tax=Anas platyrhynchos platyrhynchos TaxID=8840 RepID=A0A493T1A0_ANAPP